MTFSRHLLAIFACFAWAACAAAALPAAQTPEGPRPLRLQVYYWQRSNSTYIETVETIGQRPPPRFLEPIKLWYQNGDKFEPLTVHSGDRSPVFTVAAGKEAVFYRQDPTGLKEIPPDMILSVPVPPHVQQGLILTRDSNLRGAEMIDISDARAPKGSLRVANQTQEPIAVKIGEQVTPLKPGEFATVKAKPGDEGNINVMMARMDKNKGWGVFYSTVVTIDKDRRMLALVYPSPENAKNVKVQLMILPDN